MCARINQVLSTATKYCFLALLSSRRHKSASGHRCHSRMHTARAAVAAFARYSRALFDWGPRLPCPPPARRACNKDGYDGQMHHAATAGLCRKSTGEPAPSSKMKETARRTICVWKEASRLPCTPGSRGESRASTLPVVPLHRTPPHPSQISSGTHTSDAKSSQATWHLIANRASSSACWDAATASSPVA